MSPSILKLSAAALAYGAGAAALKTYQVSDSYDTSNFFDKFDFFEVRRPSRKMGPRKTRGLTMWYRATTTPAATMMSTRPAAGSTTRTSPRPRRWD